MGQINQGALIPTAFHRFVPSVWFFSLLILFAVSDHKILIVIHYGF